MTKRRTIRIPGGFGFLVASAFALALGCSEPATESAARDEGAISPVEEQPSMQQEPVEEPLRTREDVAEAYAVELAREPNRTDWSGGSAARGSALYASHCAICHGGEGRGDGEAAIALNPKPRDFRSGAFTIDADADGETGEPVDLARVILHGPAAFGGSPAMVAWKDVMDEGEVRDLVAFVLSLSS